MTAEVSMWEVVWAGDTDAMSDRSTGRRTESASGHHGTMPIPRPDHMPIPTMAAAEKAAEKRAE